MELMSLFAPLTCLGCRTPLPLADASPLTSGVQSALHSPATLSTATPSPSPHKEGKKSGGEAGKRQELNVAGRGRGGEESPLILLQGEQREDEFEGGGPKALALAEAVSPILPDRNANKGAEAD